MSPQASVSLGNPLAFIQIRPVVLCTSSNQNCGRNMVPRGRLEPRQQNIVPGLGGPPCLRPALTLLSSHCHAPYHSAAVVCCPRDSQVPLPAESLFSSSPPAGQVHTSNTSHPTATVLGSTQVRLKQANLSWPQWMSSLRLVLTCTSTLRIMTMECDSRLHSCNACMEIISGIRLPCKNRRASPKPSRRWNRLCLRVVFLHTGRR